MKVLIGLALIFIELFTQKKKQKSPMGHPAPASKGSFGAVSVQFDYFSLMLVFKDI